MPEESDFKATNTLILNQVGQPAPLSVLLALVEVIGGTPDAVAVVIDRGDDVTTWNVYACRGDFISSVRATKAIKDWAGGFKDEQGGEHSIAAATFRISAARSIGVENLHVYPTHEGFARESVAKWIVKFDDGQLELDEHRGHGGHVAEVARRIRKAFLAS